MPTTETTLTPPIHANKAIKVTFENDGTSTGIVLVTAGWVPKHQRMEPTSQSFAVAPKATKSINLEVPDFDDVRRLSITVSLDVGEEGWLEVFEGDREVVSKPVRITTNFEMPVDR
jgi:hypothetical protein